MTRFARAAGSKASNQRVPEESTPWYELKQQVENIKQKREEPPEKETNWKTVLDSEKKIIENKNSVWCEFEEEKPKGNKNQTKDSKKKKHQTELNVPISSPSSAKKNKKSKLSGDNLNSLNNSKKLKNIKSKLNLSANESAFQIDESTELTEDLSVRSEIDGDNQNDESVPVENNNSHKKKKLKRKFSESQDVDHETLPDDPNEVDKSNQVTDKNEKDQVDEFKTKKGGYVKDRKSSNNSITWKKQKGKGDRPDKPFKRRKMDEGDVKLEINGQEIWVTRLDGFYIKKEDAERIRELEKDLLKRGVSKQEVRAVVKKERRNAEKSLARQKKKVCFNCRKGGHTLSSCPKLEENGAQVVGSGICYKCGSTEHTHFQCKVNTGNSYKFATCFVCKQEGHISKQCPDNPRGMYPSGGGCRLCGDVTHFRRECPTLQAKANKVTVGLIDQDIETLDGQSNAPTSKEPTNKRKNKIIKFS